MIMIIVIICGLGLGSGQHDSMQNHIADAHSNLLQQKKKVTGSSASIDSIGESSGAALLNHVVSTEDSVLVLHALRVIPL